MARTWEGEDYCALSLSNPAGIGLLTIAIGKTIMEHYDDKMTDRAVECFSRWHGSKHNTTGGVWQQPSRDHTKRIGDKIFIRGGSGSETDGSRVVLATYRVKRKGAQETVSKIR